MDKVSKWRQKVDNYYNNISIKQLKNDLSLAGFKVNHISPETLNMRSFALSFQEVAVCREDDIISENEQILNGYETLVQLK